ncbi:MAG: tRNA lysidine(34) synthetase TilS [Desulfobacteraceae bacterium]|nr:tRNA lysidine(34) synthetase TilS [Desulfobacteraceae bacterium]
MLTRAREATTSPILNTVLETIENHRLFEPGASILVAVSGGADSICLLHVLYLLKSRYDLKLEAAHFDHMLRGAESKRDACFVEKMASRFCLGFHLGSGDVKSYARQNDMCIQDAARALRYEFFLRKRLETGCTHIATAHTANDQAEEVLLRLLRGASLAGLSGIPRKRDGIIIRPLLDVSRQDILKHLAASNLSFMEDSSNDDPKYLRNRVRRELLPLLANRFNPAVIKTLNRTAEMLAEENGLLEDISASAFSRCIISEPETIDGAVALAIDRIKSNPAPIRRRIYRMALKETRYNGGAARSNHLKAIDNIVTRDNPGALCHLPGRILAERCYNKLVFTKAGRKTTHAQMPRPVYITGPGLWPCPSGNGQLEITLSSAKEAISRIGPRKTPRTLWLDVRSLSFPLRMEQRRPGQMFQPFGAQQPVKLKDFLIARKVPRKIRDELPIILAGADVVAIAGIEIAHPYRIDGSSSKALSLRWTGHKWSTDVATDNDHYF